MPGRRIPRWPAQPPRGLRPRLAADQVRDLGICHLEHLDAIARGDADEHTLWQFAAAALTWSKAAELLELGEREMRPQLELASALVERFGRTGRVVFTGAEYQLAKTGIEVMDELARVVDRPTAIAAAEWSERKVNELLAEVRAGSQQQEREGSVSSLVTQMIVAEKYGPRLNIEQLATVLGITKGAVYNQISAGNFPIATYLDGGKRWADYRAVAAHLDDCAERALKAE